MLSVLTDRTEADHLRGHAAAALSKFTVIPTNVKARRGRVYRHRLTQAVIEALLRATKDDSADVRHSALGALGFQLFHVRNHKVFKAVTERLRDSDKAVSALARELLMEASVVEARSVG